MNEQFWVPPHGPVIDELVAIASGPGDVAQRWQRIVDWGKKHNNSASEITHAQVGALIMGLIRLGAVARAKEPDAAELLEYCGDDAHRWAEKFCEIARNLGHSNIDEGWMTGWFANAIEKSHDVRMRRQLPVDGRKSNV